MLWLKEFGTGQGDSLQGIAVDTQGNILAVGTTSGAFPGYSNPSGVVQAVVVKFDPNGTMLWLQQLSDASQSFPQSIAVDSVGNVLIGFQLYSSVASGFSTQGLILASFDGTTGRPLRTQQFSIAGYSLSSIAADNSGDIFALGNGNFRSASSSAPLLVKVSESTGSILWEQAFANYPASADVSLVSVAIDSQGDIIVGGAIAGGAAGLSVGYDPAPSAQCILAKLDNATGNPLWVKQFGTGAGDQIYSVAVDQSGNVFATGLTWGIFALPFVRPQDFDFAMKFTPDGQNIWVQQFGNGPILNITVIGGPQAAVDSQGNLFVGGQTQGAFSGFSNPNNAVELFVAKFGP